MNEVMSDYLWKNYRDRQVRYSNQEINASFGYYSISMIGMCLRRHYWSKTETNAPSDETLRMGALGNIIQDWSDNILKETYGDDLVKIEQSVTMPIQLPKVTKLEYVYLNGRIDHLLTIRKPTNHRYFYPIEAKYKVNKLINMIKEPDKKHKWQLLTYCLIKGASNCIIYYIDHRFKAKTFHIPMDIDFVLEGFDRIKTVHSYIENDSLPPAEAMYVDEFKGDCYFCPFSRRCQEIERQ
jgi:CRISPR/Cas system-associated exonuclease Cas4 (RecB family)